jgi:hypothetical protein
MNACVCVCASVVVHVCVCVRVCVCVCKVSLYHGELSMFGCCHFVCNLYCKVLICLSQENHCCMRLTFIYQLSILLHWYFIRMMCQHIVLVSLDIIPWFHSLLY